MTASADTTRRVALLARPGQACERLRAVLDEAGAQCVLTADPTELDTEALRGAQPHVVLVALDPLIEEVLERFDPVLADSSIDVIYEEADLAAAREGWAVARWQRHLVAKLLGHADVLPPGREPDEAPPIAASATAAVASTSSMASYAAFDPVNAEVETAFDLTVDLPVVASSDAASPAEAFEFEPVFGTLSLETPAESSPELDDPLEMDFASGLAVADESASNASGAISLGMLDPAGEPTAVLPALEEIAAVELPAGTKSVSAEAGPKPKHDLGDLERRISTLELVDDTPQSGSGPARGAVLVLSGIGGPDAVRQLLGALPNDFTRPVLVQQRLDGGRYDKLVTQLQRATKLPVKLAEPSQRIQGGVVYILPAGVGVEGGNGLNFNHQGDDVLAALPSAESAVLLLSGSDPAQVEAVMTHGCGGALVAGQAADGCYDAAAPNALAARGGETASPAQLALRLAERWPSRGTQDVQT